MNHKKEINLQIIEILMATLEFDETSCELQLENTIRSISILAKDITEYLVNKTDYETEEYIINLSRVASRCTFTNPTSDLNKALLKICNAASNLSNF